MITKVADARLDLPIMFPASRVDFIGNRAPGTLECGELLAAPAQTPPFARTIAPSAPLLRASGRQAERLCPASDRRMSLSLNLRGLAAARFGVGWSPQSELATENEATGDAGRYERSEARRHTRAASYRQAQDACRRSRAQDTEVAHGICRSSSI